MGVFLSALTPHRPAYEMSQEESLAWLAKAHARADLFAEKRPEAFFRAILEHVGCPASQIARRGFVLPDFLDTEWDGKRIYRLSEQPQGLGMDVRTLYYKEAAEQIFQKFYEHVETPPDDIIHVTCSGYTSPSAAQRLVEMKQWMHHTVVTHAYHMGCYAAIPALRMARGFVADRASRQASPHVDVVHTELCSLHLTPFDHSKEQFVIQSLFADGMIRYAVTGQSPTAQCYEILALHEETIPNSANAMTWYCSNWGMKMSLSRNVPRIVKDKASDFLARMGDLCHVDLLREKGRAIFAIHPGGPKILDDMQELLGLRHEQVIFSRDVLRRCGNMSSATLPHIWHEALTSPDVPIGTLVVSMAFGPGLTIAGAVMRKLA